MPKGLKRAIGALLAVFAIYSVLGFLILPGVALRIINQQLANYATVPARLDRLELNPYSLEVTLWGLNYRVRGRHSGQDPLLFLDLRNTRGWVKAHSAGKSVLNLFAYTCGVGLSAAAGGAREVCNLDFAEGNLAVGRENGLLNPQLPTMQFVQSDYFPAIRQLAGLPIASRRGHKLPSYVRLEQRQYDLVLLDPPAWAKSAFGTVDLLRDYQSLLKPALLTTAEDGVLICCNNLAKVSLDDWREQVLRCASKIGRPVRDCQVLTPGADFPSQDQQPPLKTLILQL